MEKHGVVLSLHGEVTDPDVDMFDRERVFVERAARAHRARLSRAEDRARAHHDARGRGSSSPRRRRNVAATITPQHLLYSRNALFAGGIRPHFYCLPILKRETHRQALVAAATSRQPEVLPRHRLRAARAGTRRRTPAAAPAATRRRVALELYAEAFEDAGALDRLEGFASRLRRRLLRPAAQRRHGDAACASLDACRPSIRSASDTVVPLRAGETRALARRRGTAHAAGACYPSAPKPARPSLPPRKRGERKVRAPQSRMPGNARPL